MGLMDVFKNKFGMGGQPEAPAPTPGVGSGGMASADAQPHAVPAQQAVAPQHGYLHGLGMALGGGQNGSAGYAMPHNGQAVASAPVANATAHPQMGMRGHIGMALQGAGDGAKAQNEMYQQMAQNQAGGMGGGGYANAPQLQQAHQMQYPGLYNAVQR